MWKKKDKHSLKTFPGWGLKLFCCTAPGLGLWCLCCWAGGSKIQRRGWAPAEIQPRHQQVEHLPPARTFTLPELQPIPVDFPLVFWENSSDFLSARAPEGNEGVARRVRSHQNPLLYLSCQHKVGILPWKFSCPGMGTASAGIQEPTEGRKGHSLHTWFISFLK